jgi:hypothetical protein
MHHKRKRARIRQRRGHFNQRLFDRRPQHEIAASTLLSQAPEFWDIIYHRRPRRRLERRFERQAKFDHANADAIPWPVSGKPHRYFW